MATNFVKASFQEIYDLHTTTNTSTVLGVHTPISTRVHQYLHGFFQQYKQFRYDGCSLVFIPVSQLPVDPLQVGTEAGYVDPRDLVNPIVHCGIHGESLGNTLEQLFNLSLTKSIYDGLDVLSAEESNTEVDAGYLESMYYTALASPSFQKAHVQRGFRKSRLVPLAYQMQSNHQLMPYYSGGTDYVTVSPNSAIATEPWGPADNRPENDGNLTLTPPSGGTDGHPLSNSTDPFAPMYQMRLAEGIETLSYKSATQMFSGNLSRLGWLDTLQTSTRVYENSSGVEVHDGGSFWTALPKLYMYLVMLPPCYMQKMYFRVVMTHHYSFRNFRASKGPLSLETVSPQAYTSKPLWGLDVTPELGSPYEPAKASLDDTLTAINGDVMLVTDGVS